jgi:hypothetical protein
VSGPQETDGYPQPPSGTVTLAGDVTGPSSANTFDLTLPHVWLANQTAPALVASGLTGAVAASRYVGGTASGAPASGTFAVGDYIITQDGHVFVCTTAGSPGTWVDASDRRIVYSNLLAVDTAVIDTLAVIPGKSLCSVYLSGRTDEAVVFSPVSFTLNNDSGAKYDDIRLRGLNTTVTAAPTAGATAFAEAFLAGANATANVFGMIELVMHNYAGIVGNKPGFSRSGVPDPTAANTIIQHSTFQYQDTATPITRLAATPSTGGAKFKAGTLLTVIAE